MNLIKALICALRHRSPIRSTGHAPYRVVCGHPGCDRRWTEDGGR